MTQTGLTITQKGKRIEVDSDKLKTLKYARYNNKINDEFIELLKTISQPYE